MKFLIILFIIVIIYSISSYNKFIRIHHKVEEALSGIDIALAKRYATLNNIVEVVKGYTKHEKEVLIQLIHLRENPTIKERINVDENHRLATTQLFVLQENYPELKANKQFLSFMHTIEDLEEHLAASRRMYNSNVSIYNDLVFSFPSNLIGIIIHAKKKEYFQADPSEKENISVKL